MTKSITTILFDLGGVILNLNYNATIESFKKLGKENFEELYTQFQQDDRLDQWEEGQISPYEFRQYMASFLDKDVTDEQINHAWNAMLGNLPKERFSALQTLKKRYQLILFSNTNEIHYSAFREIILQEHGTADLLESVFDKTYYSHLLGARKPNANAFQKILNENNLTKEEVLFVDDSIQHIEGAKKMGINTVHFKEMEFTEFCEGLLE